MKRYLIHHSALLSLVGLLAALTPCRSVYAADNGKGRDTNIRINQQSQSQLVGEGSRVIFAVEESFRKSFRHPTHHWFFNGSPINAESAGPLRVTDYDTPKLLIKSAGLTNVGFYSYLIEAADKKGGVRYLHSGVTELMVFRGNGSPTVVYGTPIAGAGGAATSCPGPYAGYVTYSCLPFGWYVANPAGGKAYDAIRSDTKVRYYGVPYSNSACNTNIPYSIFPYYFRTYFPSEVPTGPYPLTLEGFK